jgi:hypothetical protein
VCVLLVCVNVCAASVFCCSACLFFVPPRCCSCACRRRAPVAVSVGPAPCVPFVLPPRPCPRPLPVWASGPSALAAAFRSSAAALRLAPRRLALCCRLLCRLLLGRVLLGRCLLGCRLLCRVLLGAAVFSAAAFLAAAFSVGGGGVFFCFIALHWLLAEEPSLHSNVRDRQHAAGHRSSQILRSSTALLEGVKEAVSAEDFPGFQNSSMDHSDKFARGAYTKPHKKVSGSLPPPPSMPPPGCGLVWLEKQNFTAAVHGCTPRWWCPPRWCPPAS